MHKMLVESKINDNILPFQLYNNDATAFHSVLKDRTRDDRNIHITSFFITFVTSFSLDNYIIIHHPHTFYYLS